MAITLALGVPQSLNGEVGTPGSSAQIVVEVVLTLTSQNIATNESVVHWEFRLREYVNASPFNNNAGSVGNCTVNVPVFAASNLTYNFDLTNETIVYGSGDITIGHNSDGTKSFTSSGSFSGQGGSPLSSGSFSDTVNLPTIPRATTPVPSTSTPDTGAAVNVTLTPADSGFSHRLYWEFQPGTGGSAIDNKINGLAGGSGSATGSVEAASADGTAGNYWGVPSGTRVPTLTIPHAVFAQATAETSRTVTLTVETWNSGTYIGTKTITLQVTLAASQKPTIAGITHSEATTTPAVASLVGAYVQAVTKLALALTSPAGIHGSTIVSRSISVAGQTLSADGTTPLPIANSGTVAITATVTDSRGRVSDVATQNVTVLAWQAPQFATSPEVKRALTTAVADDNGTYIKIDPADFSVSSLVVSAVQKNKVEYRLSYRLYGAGSWTVDGAGWIDPSDTPSGIRFTGTRLSTFGSAAVGSAYEVMIEIRDVLATSFVTRILPKAKVLMHWKGSLGVSFGARHSGGSNPLEIWGRGKQATDLATLRNLLDLGDAASDAQAQAKSSTSVFLTPANLAAVAPLVIADLAALPTASSFIEGTLIHVDALNVDFQQRDGVWVQNGIATVSSVSNRNTEYAKASAAYRVNGAQVRVTGLGIVYEYMTTALAPVSSNAWYPVAGVFPAVERIINGNSTSDGTNRTLGWETAGAFTRNIVSGTDGTLELSSGVFTVRQPGRWKISSMMTWSTGSTFTHQDFYKNSTLIRRHQAVTSASSYTTNVLIYEDVFAAGDTFRTDHNAGAALQIVKTDGGDNTHIIVEYMGPG